MRIGIGLGVYPTLEDGSTNPCYDTNRPWYLPHFIDTWEEEACKHARGSYFFDVVNTPGVDAQVVESRVEIAGRSPATTGDFVESAAVLMGVVVAGVFAVRVLLKR